MARGARVVRYADGKSVEYESRAEMLAQLRLMEREVAAAANIAPRPRTLYPAIGTGVR